VLETTANPILVMKVNANSATGVNGVLVPNHATVELRPDLVHAHVETVMEIRSKLANVIHTVARTCLNHKMEKNSAELVSITVPRNPPPAVPTDQMIVLSLCLMAARASVMPTVSEKKVTVAPITSTNVCQISSQQWCPRRLLLRGCLKATQDVHIMAQNFQLEVQPKSTVMFALVNQAVQ
jgi:hypothetical protein